MKIKNVVILILLLIICGQFIQSFLLLKKFDRLNFTFVRKPIEVYSEGLTESVHDITFLKSEITLQHNWLSKRLCKCIERLEQQEGLEPIPIEGLAKYQMPGQLSSFAGPNRPKPMTYTSELFYEPYEDPNFAGLEDKRERDIRQLKSMLNLQIIGTRMYLEPSKIRIENYEKRLKRLEEHWNR